MRKVVVHAPGGYEELRIETHPEPPLGTGEVRIDVEACGVNYADCIVRMGLYESAKKYVGWPITPGFEVAGVVRGVGERVTAVRRGDAVLAVTRFGGYASEVVVPERQVWKRPARLGSREAAAFPSVHLTAWYALFALAQPRPGARLLVHSAAGGVGTALCALARVAGFEAVGVVGSAHKIDAARDAGATHVIDKSTQDLFAEAARLAPEGYDVVLDANGPTTLRGSYAALRPGGRLVVYGFHGILPRGRGKPSLVELAVGWLRTPRFDPLRMTGDNRSVMAFNLSYMFDRADLLREAMTQLLGWVETGSLPPPRVTPYPFERVADAHRAIESGETTGKLVLVV